MTDEERAYIAEASREQRKKFVAQITQAIESGPVACPDPARAAENVFFTRQEAADVLRRMADTLDKADQRERLLKGAAERLEKRHPPHAFFSRSGYVRDYWNGTDHEPKIQRDQRLGPRVDFWSTDEAKAKAAEARPMRHFGRDRDDDFGPEM